MTAEPQLLIQIARLKVIVTRKERQAKEKCYAAFFIFYQRTEPISRHSTYYNAHTSTTHSSTSSYHPSSIYWQKKISASPTNHRAKTFTTPSPPALTTNLPSLLQQTSQTPSPRMARWETMSCVQILFSRDQKRMLASCPAETASRPSLERQRADMAEGWASMV